MKALYTAALALLAAPLMAQTLSQDFETDNTRTKVTSKCWDVPGTDITTSTSERIAGTYSMRTGALTGGLNSPNGVYSPWMKLTPGGTIKVKAKMNGWQNGNSRTFFIAIVDYAGVSINNTRVAQAAPSALYTHTFTSSNWSTVVSPTITIPANLDASKVYKVLFVGYGTGGTARAVIDDIAISGTYWSDPANSCKPKVEVPVTSEVTYPMSGTGTLLFEDLWPAKGDYDFNDLVVDYNIKATITSNNQVQKAIFTFITRAAGSTFKNGLGLQLDGIATRLVSSASKTGGDDTGFSVNSKGTENGQNYANFPVYGNVFKYMPQPGGGTGTNVTPGAPTVKSHTTVITVNFTEGLSLEVFNASFNPYLIVNQDRGKEVHLPNKQPSALASGQYFHTSHDNSNPAVGRYYKTAQNLPWALNTPVSIPHPKERAEVTSAYLKLLEWASSNGASFTDWYMPSGGYRNQSNLMN
jgi:LruC domain-containing protein